MNRDVVAEGKVVMLRPLVAHDIEGDYVGWLNDPEVTEFNAHGDSKYTKEKALAYIQKVSESPSDLVLAVVAKDSGKHIGNVSLQEINTRDRNAEFAILIGNKDYWGKGVGLEAASLIIEYGFTELKLHRVYCGTSSKNRGMQKLAQKLGFLEEGRRKDAQYKRGEFNDIIEYGLIRN